MSRRDSTRGPIRKDCAVDADGSGRPTVAGIFTGPVDLGEGTITPGSPASVIIARFKPSTP